MSNRCFELHLLPMIWFLTLWFQDVEKTPERILIPKMALGIWSRNFLAATVKEKFERKWHFVNETWNMESQPCWCPPLSPFANLRSCFAKTLQLARSWTAVFQLCTCLAWSPSHSTYTCTCRLRMCLTFACQVIPTWFHGLQRLPLVFKEMLINTIVGTKSRNERCLVDQVFFEINMFIWIALFTLSSFPFWQLWPTGLLLRLI